MDKSPIPTSLLPSSSSGKKKAPTAEELVAHYESQGLGRNEASLKVIGDLQNVLFRMVSSKGGQKDRDKLMARSSRMLDTVNTRLAIMEMKLDSKPGYVETLGIVVAGGAILKGAECVVPHVVGTIGEIWKSVRSSTKSHD